MKLFKRNQKSNLENIPGREAVLFKKITESEDYQDKTRKEDFWRPRRMRVSSGVNKTGLPELYLEGSPEQVLGEFLFSWKEKDFLKMAEIVMPLTKETSFAKFTKHITEVFVEVEVQEFYFLDFEDLNPSTSKITVKIKHFTGEKAGELTLDVKMKFLNSEGAPGVFGFDEGVWSFDYSELHPIYFFPVKNFSG